MFRWCSFCQRFLGESEPRNDFSLTHGMCSPCKSNIQEGQKHPSSEIAPITEFFQNLFGANTSTDTNKLLDQALALKIKPIDLLAGILQPVLNDLGEKYKNGEDTNILENQFATFADQLATKILEVYGLATRPTEKEQDVLLVASDGNYHYLGIRFIEVFLKQEGISTYTVFPNLPAKEIYKVANILNAKVIGISVTLKEQFEEVVSSLDLFSGLKNKPLVIIGGQGIQKDAVLPEFAALYDGDLYSMLGLVQTRLSKSLATV